jgi:hypothetical protein
VALQPDSKIALADNRLVLEKARVGIEPGAAVSIKDGSAVAIKPGAKVGVEGAVTASGTVTVAGQMQQANAGDDIAGIRRAVDQLRTERAGAGGDYGRNGAKVMRSITTFQEVAYGSGKVVTGWNWGSSNDTSPSQQYCYYDQGGQGASIRIDLARDGRELPVTRAPRGFQAQDAAANCIWFDGQRTRGTNSFQ